MPFLLQIFNFGCKSQKTPPLKLYLNIVVFCDFRYEIKNFRYESAFGGSPKMISYLKGKIKHRAANFVILEVNNIGYQIFISPALYADLSLNQEAEFYTYQQVREDALNLYGFKNPADLGMFELLLSISGIGPKSALGVMSIATVDDIKESISRGDPALLTKVSGIGRKTAERVVLELREKIGKLGFGDGKSGGGQMGSGDEIDALMALGYSLTQAREALNNVDAKIKDSGERIRQALKRLGK